MFDWLDKHETCRGLWPFLTCSRISIALSPIFPKQQPFFLWMFIGQAQNIIVKTIIVVLVQRGQCKWGTWIFLGDW